MMISETGALSLADDPLYDRDLGESDYVTIGKPKLRTARETGPKNIISPHPYNSVDSTADRRTKIEQQIKQARALAPSIDEQII